MTKFLSTAKLRVFRMLCAHDADVRTVGFAVSFRSCRAIQGGFLLLAMLCSYLVSDTWSLPSLSRSTKRKDTLNVSLIDITFLVLHSLYRERADDRYRDMR